VSENVREGLAAAELQDDNKNAPPVPPVPPVPKPNRRRSRQLLQVDANLNGGGSKEEEKEQGRIADSALESLSELMKQTTNIKKKIILWKKIFPPLPEDQKKNLLFLWVDHHCQKMLMNLVKKNQ